MSKALLVIIVVLLAASAHLGGRASRRAVAQGTTARQEPRPPGEVAPVRFSAIDVFIDSGDAPLAAYQFELSVTAGDVTLVGVEGGEHRAFTPPPYYDPKALAGRRIVIAAFDTGSDLPRGRTRVARLMVRVSGGVTPAFDTSLLVAASADAKTIPATISVSDTPEPEGAER